MEPNELDLLPTDGLVRLILSARDSRAQYVLPKHDDGVTLDFEQYGFLELSHELARRTTALQAKIDGMIERPVVVVVEVNSFHDYEVRINGETFKRFTGQPNSAWADNYAKALTTALGMDDATNTKEPQ